MSKQITAEQVAQQKFNPNNKSSLCWIIIHSNVYDVTKFLNEHPGGADTLIAFAGKDATQAFDDKGHSASARELLKKYKIGQLPGDSKHRLINAGISSDATPGRSWSYWWLLALMIVLGGAFIAKQKMAK